MVRKNFYFQRSNGEIVLLAENVTEKEAMIVMHAFLNERNYKSYYTRIIEQPECRMYDVGSWTEFFYWGETK
jgi:hypothetical protein